MPLRKNDRASAAPEPLVLPEPERPKMAVPSNASPRLKVSPGIGENRTKGVDLLITHGGGLASSSTKLFWAVVAVMGSRTFNGEVRELLKDAAKEMGFAVDSIRKEVIEKGWFDRKDLTPEVADRWAREKLGPTEPGITGPQDFSREASREEIYGHDPERYEVLEKDRSVER